jgi:hypothetical protein
MSMEAVMALAPKQSASSTVNKKLQEIYHTESIMYIEMQTLTGVVKRKNKMWIGRTELPL